MGKILRILILLLIVGCVNDNKPNPNKIVSKNEIDVLEIQKVKPVDYLKNVQTTKGDFFLKDLTNDFCLVFGLTVNKKNCAWRNINLDSLMGYIVNPSYEESINLNELRAQRGHIYPNNDSLPIFNFENSVIIPFNSSEDKAHLTIWEKGIEDKISFVEIMYPPIFVTHLRIVSIEIFEINLNKYLKLYLEGGEGGANWAEIIISKFDSNGIFNEIQKETVGYCHDCGNWAKIAFSLSSEGYQLTEIIDSMILENDTWKRVNRVERKLATVKL